MLVIGFTIAFLANLRILVKVSSHPVAYLKAQFIYLLTYKLFLNRFKLKKDGCVRVSLIFNMLG